MMEFLNIPGEEILSAILAAAPEDLDVRVFLGISRNAYTEFLGPKLDDAVEKWDRLSGIDLHGPEDLPIESWTPAFGRKQPNGDSQLRLTQVNLGLLLTSNTQYPNWA